MATSLVRRWSEVEGVRYWSSTRQIVRLLLLKVPLVVHHCGGHGTITSVWIMVKWLQMHIFFIILFVMSGSSIILEFMSFDSHHLLSHRGKRGPCLMMLLLQVVTSIIQVLPPPLRDDVVVVVN